MKRKTVIAFMAVLGYGITDSEERLKCAWSGDLIIDAEGKPTFSCYEKWVGFWSMVRQNHSVKLLKKTPYKRRNHNHLYEGDVFSVKIDGEEKRFIVVANPDGGFVAKDEGERFKYTRMETLIHRESIWYLGNYYANPMHRVKYNFIFPKLPTTEKA